MKRTQILDLMLSAVYLGRLRDCELIEFCVVFSSMSLGRFPKSWIFDYQQ